MRKISINITDKIHAVVPSEELLTPKSTSDKNSREKRSIGEHSSRFSAYNLL